MGKFGIKIDDSAKGDFAKIYKAGNQATIKKLEKIILELSEHPTESIGNPERLKHHLSGYWSRRINKKDRLIYKSLKNQKN